MSCELFWIYTTVKKMENAIFLYVILFILIFVDQSLNNATSLNVAWRNTSELSNTNTTIYVNDVVEEQDNHRCSYKQQQYCHSYIKNMFALYTRSGGWILLGIILCGIFFQVLSHLLDMKQTKKVTLGIVQSTNIPLQLNISQPLL